MSDIDVLVVGAGPTGLTLASELLRRGLRVRVIDKSESAVSQSRALAIHARTLEIFDDLGIADELVARGLEVTNIAMWSKKTPVIELDFAELATRYPFVLCIPQQETEAVLGELLGKHGGAVERHTELVSFAQTADGVDALVRGPNGEEHVRAAWIAGCDGAHSTVRKAVGATFEGHTYEETFALADVRIAWDVPSDHISTFFAEDGAVAFFPMKSGRWRVIATAAASLGETVTLEGISALATKRCGIPVPMTDAVWLAPFHINCRQVASYRHDRAFLCGDAAHVHSPVGGQGMNTGIQDAHNLGWKLALVQQKRGRPALLDSYTIERHAVGKQVLRNTDIATRLGTLHGIAASVRNHMARVATSVEPVRRRMIQETAELTVDYATSPIVGEHTSSAFGVRIGRADAGEAPTISSRRSFERAPGPGARALDARVGKTRLSKQFDGRRFMLLLCDGRHASDGGYETLVTIAQRVEERYGDLVATFIVTPRADRPTEIPEDIAVLNDTLGELEDRYGAETECLYLIRPDLYVGFRSQPADGPALEAHLAELLV